MNDAIVNDNIWMAAAVVWGGFALIALGRPRALWRRLSAHEVSAPWLVTLGLLGGAALASMMVSFHLNKLLEATTQHGLAQPTITDFLNWFLAFAWHGLTGPVTTRAYLQAVLVSSGVLAIFAALLYRQRYSLFEMDIVDRRGEGAPPRRIVVMGLSLNPGLAEDEKAAEAAIEAFTAIASTLDLEAAASADLKGFPWQQNLRVLRHHLLRELPRPTWVKRVWAWATRRPRGELCRVVVVVPSRETARYANAFVAVAKACVDNSRCADVQFKIWERPVDYNNLGALRRELKSVVRTVQENEAIAARLDEISIDTTPGMKLVSIAGAAVTFASPLEFTYVENTSPHSVVAFDVRAAFRIPFER
jgi:hypothetical protein